MKDTRGQQFSVPSLQSGMGYPYASTVLKSACCLIVGLFAVVLFSAAGVVAQDLGSIGKPNAGSGGSSGSSGSGRSGGSRRKTPPKKRVTPPKRNPPATARQKANCGTQKFASDAERRVAFDKASAEGREFFAKRDFRRAESAFKNAIQSQCDAEAYVALGRVYKAEQRWSLAEDSFRNALAVSSNNVNALVALSNVMTRLTFTSEVGGGRLAEAETLARRAVFLSPTSAEANQQLGEALESLGRISRETQAYYEQATRLAPKSASAFAHLARILRKNGKIKEAAKAMTAALSLATDVESKIDVGEVLQTLQQFGDSEKLLKEALSQDESNPLGLQLLARALARQQKNEEAEAVLTKAVASGAQSVVPFLSLGGFYLQRQRLDDAEKALLSAASVAVGDERRNVARQFEVLSEAFIRGGRAADANRVLNYAKVLQAGRSIDA